MADINLTYFNLKGRAELSRLILAYAGVKYTDERIQKESWAKMKPTTPWGSLPLLSIDGKTVGQSIAIARYLAREHGLAGRNSLEMAEADEVVDAFRDLSSGSAENVPAGLAKLEKCLTERGGQFFAGNNLTWADIAAFNYCTGKIEKDSQFLVKTPKLGNLVKRVGELPNIKKWVEKAEKKNNVAIVTGSNKGIGLGIVRALCGKFKGDVYLTSRDEGRGLAAVKLLQKEGLNPIFHQLDIESEDSIKNLRDTMKLKYGGIDVLVNNAGFAFNQNATESFGHQATVTLGLNYWSNKNACNILFPILKPGARVVNMSSSAGFLGHLDKSTNQVKAKALKKKLSSDDLTVEELDELMRQFVKTANQGTHGDHGWINSTYVTSKIGWSALSRIQQRKMLKDDRADIVVNHVHPGFVDTDMTNGKGHLTIDRGAQSAVFAALLPPGTSIKGAYIWHDCQLVDWVNGPTPPMT